jgi:serine/threonine protein kinase
MEHEFYGRYRLVRPLGEGGMASVYLAEDPVLRRAVALKKLKRELGAQPDWVRRFHGEATSVARLGNPHVVQVFDLGRDHEEDFLVMELVEGISLGSLLERHEGPLSPDAAAAIAFQAASGLAAAHEAAVVHRDVKPDNLLIRRDGTVKVADFGIARLTEEISRTLTGTVMGSPLYMAPEQIEGKTPTGALDVFALGGLLYRMLTGRTPFEADHAHAVMWRIVSEAHVPLSQAVPGIEPALADFVDLLLRKDPLQRPSAAEAVRTLRQFLSAGGVGDPVEFVRARVLPDDVRRAVPLSVSPKLVGGTLPDAPPRPKPPVAAKPRSTNDRRILLWASLGVAGVALALLVGILVGTKSPSSVVGGSAPSPAPESESPGSVRPETPSSDTEDRSPDKGAEPSAPQKEAPLPSPATGGGESLVEVLGRDEAPGETNAFKPRLAFRNTGSRTIRAFRMEWDLPGDMGRRPVVETYYAPGCDAALASSGSGIRLVVTCRDLRLKPGQLHPGQDGLSLGIHYPDWSKWPRPPDGTIGRTLAPVPGARVVVEPDERSSSEAPPAMRGPDAKRKAKEARKQGKKRKDRD